MKLVIVGGGSTYTPELISGVIENYKHLPFQEICLTDNDQIRLEILTKFTGRMIKSAGLNLAVTSTVDRKTALTDADFVNCLIRVGGMDARINDERIPLKYGIVGQETTGPGGMMKAFRTIPVILDLAHEMEVFCPKAWLINYTNPSGIIAEALGNFSSIKWVGLCSGPNEWKKEIFHALGIDQNRGSIDWIGLNHLGFAKKVWVDGADWTMKAVEAIADNWSIDRDWLLNLGLIPATYLQYYFHHDRIVKNMTREGYQTRGEKVKEIENELLVQYADEGLTSKPELLKQRGGGGYSETAFASMRSLYHNTGDTQFLQTMNQGAVDGIAANASVEIPCVLYKSGPRPVYMGEIPISVRGLFQSVKCYETLTVKAAVEGSKQIALQALMAHPFIRDWDLAKEMMEELLQTNKQWLRGIK